MRRAKVVKPKKGAIKLPAPRPLYGLQAELYELLVVDLEAAVEGRNKLQVRLDRTTSALAAAVVREKRLRNQLATFAPSLEGFEHDAGQVDKPAESPGDKATETHESPGDKATETHDAAAATA